MRPAWFAMLGVLASASLNVLMERKLHMITPIIGVIVMEATVVVLALVIFLTTGRSTPGLTIPQGWQWVWLATCGVLLLACDFCFLSAYKGGGKVEVIATIVATFPIVAILLKYLTGGNPPNSWQIIGSLLTCLGVIIVVRHGS